MAKISKTKASQRSKKGWQTRRKGAAVKKVGGRKIGPITTGTSYKGNRQARKQLRKANKGNPGSTKMYNAEKFRATGQISGSRAPEGYAKQHRSARNRALAGSAAIGVGALGIAAKSPALMLGGIAGAYGADVASARSLDKRNKEFTKSTGHKVTAFGNYKQVSSSNTRNAKTGTRGANSVGTKTGGRVRKKR